MKGKTLLLWLTLRLSASERHKDGEGNKKCN